jgi:pyruvate kinase
MNVNSTKVIATIGPATRSYERIRELLEAGVNVVRLNFSHGSHSDHQKTVQLVRRVAKELGVIVAIFQDLQGPKVRLGEIEDGEALISTGDSFVISTEPCTGTAERACIDYPTLHEEVKPGDRILIDDGLVSLQVERIEGRDIHTTVAEGGCIKPHKGVNLPHTVLKRISSFTEKDRDDLYFAFANNLEYVALSFVRTAEDVRQLYSYMEENFGRKIPIIAKIEKPEALDDIENIIRTADAVMVARGDLGVETSTEEVPVIQKNIIRTCNLMGKPVITATQMLESMIDNPRPTRAEAADVANAVLDGTSAVMLSGETAAGKHPGEAVRTISRIVNSTERSSHFRRIVADRRPTGEEYENGEGKSPAEAVGMSARELARQVGARYIVCFTHSGGTARLISKYRPMIPIAALSPIPETVRRLALAWGVFPMDMDEVSTVDDLFVRAPAILTEKGLVSAGDYLVVTAGVPVGAPGKTNMIKVVQVEG